MVVKGNIWLFFKFCNTWLNDLKVSSKIILENIYIDTIKEFITLSNISMEALPEIESEITKYMMEDKKNMHYKIKKRTSI